MPRLASILLASLGAFAALGRLGLLASATGGAWMLGSFGVSCVLAVRVFRRAILQAKERHRRAPVVICGGACLPAHAGAQLVGYGGCGCECSHADDGGGGGVSRVCAHAVDEPAAHRACAECRISPLLPGVPLVVHAAQPRTRNAEGRAGRHHIRAVVASEPSVRAILTAAPNLGVVGSSSVSPATPLRSTFRISRGIEGCEQCERPLTVLLVRDSACLEPATN